MDKFKKEDFKYTQRKKAFHLFITISLCITFFFGLNFLAAKYYARKDITHNRIYSLSPESVAYLRQLKTPVEIIITIPPQAAKKNYSRIYKDIVSLAEEYEHVTRKNDIGKISILHIDPYSQSQKAYEIANKYNVQSENAIIIATEQHHKEIPGNELYSFKDGEITAFRGEQTFTSAILDVVNPNRNKIYFLAGHGEMRINNTDPLRGISQSALLLQKHNYNIDQLDLIRNGKVPDDASLIIAAAPQAPLLPAELEMLKRYLADNNGRAIFFLEPGKNHGLDALLHDWGIHSDDMLIQDSGKDFQANGGDLIIRHFAQHAITNFLIENQLTVITGFSRPVRPDPAFNPDSRNHVQPLLASSETSWAQRAYQNNSNPQIDPQKDLQGPVTLATLSERKINTNLGISIAGGKLLVFGNSGFITNNKLNALGNKILFQNTINWALDKNDLLNIPPRSLEKFQIILSQQELYHVGLGLMSIPAILGLLGIVTYTFRKR